MSPQSSDERVDSFLRAGRLSDLQEGLPEGIVLPNGERVCLVRQGEAVWAVHDVCPHRGFALSGGECVVSPDGTPMIECPWHGARFSCASGAVMQGPATDALPTYDVDIRDGDVYVGPRHDPRSGTEPLSSSLPEAS